MVIGRLTPPLRQTSGDIRDLVVAAHAIADESGTRSSSVAAALLVCIGYRIAPALQAHGARGSAAAESNRGEGPVTTTVLVMKAGVNAALMVDRSDGLPRGRPTPAANREVARRTPGMHLASNLQA